MDIDYFKEIIHKLKKLEVFNMLLSSVKEFRMSKLNFILRWF
jgi:hypothetical protein